MNFQNIKVSLDQGVVTVVLNRPGAFNALDLAMARELYDLANRLGGNPDVRAIVLTGSGEKAFCAGGDVASFAAAGEGAGLLLKEVTGYLHMAVTRLSWGSAPVIAAVNGVAAGAGLSLMAACDLAVASETATFTSAYTKLGLSPDGSATHHLPRLVGARRAMEMFLTNRVLTAAEALDWGLVNRVVPSSELAEVAGKLARGLADGPTMAHGAVKHLLGSSFAESLETQMERETRYISTLAVTGDGQEGLSAFAGKRKPKFSGR